MQEVQTATCYRTTSICRQIQFSLNNEPFKPVWSHRQIIFTHGNIESYLGIIELAFGIPFWFWRFDYSHNLCQCSGWCRWVSVPICMLTRQYGFFQVSRWSKGEIPERHQTGFWSFVQQTCESVLYQEHTQYRGKLVTLQWLLKYFKQTNLCWRMTTFRNHLLLKWSIVKLSTIRFREEMLSCSQQGSQNHLRSESRGRILSESSGPARYCKWRWIQIQAC